ncbi:insulinase family protein [bacterium]|nr:insulinase family protein [bacterium]
MSPTTVTPYPDAPDLLAPSDLAPGLHTARLGNGLRVVIREDRRTPVAVCNVWVRVGSNREPEALRGWSHGIEHMLFKGTARRGEGDFALEVAAAGGATNAGTGYETTNYHITVPAENIAVAVDILADALFHSRFEPASLDAERKVLVHENHMYDDIPFGFGVTWRWGCELAFDHSPYRHPIGGRDENLLERDRADIIDFWRSAYRPDNMTLVVVGDVDAAATFALVREHFGQVGPERFADALASPQALVAEPPVEPLHQGPRLRIEHGDIKKAYAKLIFPGPGEREGLDPVQSVVRRVLSDGRSCRLYRRVQEERGLVDEIVLAGENGPREGLILVDMETGPDRLAAAIRAAATELALLAAEGCTTEELARAITRVSRAHVMGAETVQGQAANLGRSDVNDDLAGAYSFPAEVAAVTADDVARFCRRYFALSGLSVVVYLPDGTDAAACGIPTDAAHLQRFLADVLPAAPGEPVTPPARPVPVGGTARGDARAGGAPRFETLTLAGGLEVFCRVDRALPLVTLSLTRPGGATGETEDTAGLSSLTQAVLVKGAGGRDAEALHALLEGEGASLSPVSDRDYSGLAMAALPDRLDLPLALLADTIAAPAFAPDEIAQEQRLAREELAATEDNPVQSAVVRLRRMMYGEHPYGRPLVGTHESIGRPTRDDLLARHRRAWERAGLQVVVSGDVDPDDIGARLEAILKDLPAGRAERPAPGPLTAPDGVVHERIVRRQNQGVVLAAWPGAADPDTDRIPHILLRHVLNGQSGRLFESLRNRQSLCYNTGTVGTSGFGQGFFLGYVLTAPDTMEQARDALVREIRALADAVVPAVEFERVRAELLGNILIGVQSNMARLVKAGRDRIYGRDANNVDEVIAAVRACPAVAVRDLAGRLFTDECRWEVFLGPE